MHRKEKEELQKMNKRQAKKMRRRISKETANALSQARGLTTPLIWSTYTYYGGQPEYISVSGYVSDTK